MDKINLENLFNCKTNNFKTIDVSSLSGKYEQHFNINKLIETKEHMREKLLDEHIKYYKLCIKQIELTNLIGKTDILFVIDEKKPDLPLYNSFDCLKYIENKLTSNYFNTQIINKTTMFITWEYIEVNMRNLKFNQTLKYN